MCSEMSEHPYYLYQAMILEEKLGLGEDAWFDFKTNQLIQYNKFLDRLRKYKGNETTST